MPTQNAPLYLADPISVSALDAAITDGVIHRILAGEPHEMSELWERLLIRADVLDGAGGLHADFAALWHTQEALLTARVRFIRRATVDVVCHFEALIGDLQGFMGKADTFRIFDYSYGEGTDADSLEATSASADYLSALTALEAPELVPLIGAQSGLWLEPGGNVGDFASALIADVPGLDITVIDLPAVCRLGRERNPEVRFHPGDLRDPETLLQWQGKAEGVLFKSVLHDWPEPDARGFLERAAATLTPGGRIVVAERGAFADEHRPLVYGDVANLVFSPFYRPPEVTEGWLSDLGLSVSRETVQLDMAFHVITAVRT